MKKSLMVVVIACAAVLPVGEARAKPLKVYILAGQSNMQGRCKFGTVEYMKKASQTVPILEKMAN